MCGPGNSTRIVASPSGEYYSYEDALRNGCGSQCTPHNFLGSYVGSEVYYPNCETGTNCGGCCNIAKVNTGGGGGRSRGTYGQTSYGMSITSGMGETGSCNIGGEPVGPCVRGLDSNVLIPADNQMGCGAFEGILIDRPRDLMWGNALGGDVTVLTTTRNQTRDLRGDIQVGLVNCCCEDQNCRGGCCEVKGDRCNTGIRGPFCGTNLPAFGPFQGDNPCNGGGYRDFIF